MPLVFMFSHLFAAIAGAVLLALFWHYVLVNEHTAKYVIDGIRSGVRARGHCPECRRSVDAQTDAGCTMCGQSRRSSS